MNLNNTATTAWRQTTQPVLPARLNAAAPHGYDLYTG